MKIAVFSDKTNSLRIETEIRAIFQFVPNIELVFASPDDITNTDFIIIDFGLIKKYKFIINEHLGKSILLFLDGFIFDPNDSKKIKKLEDQLMQLKQWDKLRRINNAKIYYNHLMKKHTLDTMPNYLQLELTNYCNSRCIMCPHSYQGNVKAQHLTIDTFENTQVLLPYIQVVALHGNGEPFMNPNLGKIIALFKQYDINVSTCTNLSIFNGKLASMVNECFSDIRVSCDACTKEVYENIRLGLSFERFVQNLELLKEKCSVPHKVLSFVIMRQNISQISGMVEFAHRYGFDEVIFSNMMPSAALDNDFDAPVHYGSAVKYQLNLARHLAEIHNIKITYPDSYTDFEPNIVELNESFLSTQDWKNKIRIIQKVLKSMGSSIIDLKNLKWEELKLSSEGICNWIVERAYIDVEGNVCVCCVNSTYCLGNINRTPFDEIWNCETVQKIRKQFYDGYFPDFCRNCQFILNNSLSFLNHNHNQE